MSLPLLNQTLQYIAWVLALIEVSLSIYVLALNIRHIANRHMSALFFLFAINSYALGLFLSAETFTQARLPTHILASTIATILPTLLLFTLITLKIDWVGHNGKKVVWAIYFFIFLPVLLTVIDILFASGLWYTGLEPNSYSGGYVTLSQFATGSLAWLVQIPNLYIAPVLQTALIIYLLWSKQVTPGYHRLAWILLGAQFTYLAVYYGTSGWIYAPIASLLSNAIFVLAYGYAGFQQMISERRLQRGGLQIRLTALILTITLPLMVAMTILVTDQVKRIIEQVVVQHPGSELLASIVLFQRISWLVLIVGLILLVVLARLTIRQSIHPIHALTEAALSARQGNLSAEVQIESSDEIGQLSQAFNGMVSQLRDLISDLEKRVNESAFELEKQTIHGLVTTEVSREAIAIRDLNQLLEHVVHIISNRFGFFHTGIFLVDETSKYVMLCASSSETGHTMLSRGYKVKIGSEGIVGEAAGKREPCTALYVGEEVVSSHDPHFPQTRSETALPLKIRQQVIGVLDVQSTEVRAISEKDISALQSIADQIALAIDNARLLQESQQALQELEKLYRRQVTHAWQKRLKNRPVGYLYTPLGVEDYSSQDLPLPGADGHILTLPILLRGQSIGSLILRRDHVQSSWSKEEVELVKVVLMQVALALENVRLLEENRRQAANEHLMGQIAARTQSSLDLETVMRRAVTEIGQAVGAAKVQIRMENNNLNGRE